MAARGREHLELQAARPIRPGRLAVTEPAGRQL
jgi:hypothetical protein